MPVLRAGVEWVLLLLFGLARAVFVLQAVALGCASAVAFLTASPESPAWLRGVANSALLLSATFLIAGVMLFVTRRWRVPPASAPTAPAWPWPLLLGLSLLALSSLAVVASSGLPALWSRIADQLEATGFWEEWGRGGSNAGLVMLPLMLALFVPALVTASALFAMAFPLTLLPSLATRSRLFPTLLALGVVCQAAFVISGWLSSDALSRLAREALAAMTASGDVEVLRVADDLQAATAVLTRTATALVAPLVALLVWLVFLRPSGPASSYFSED